MYKPDFTIKELKRIENNYTALDKLNIRKKLQKLRANDIKEPQFKQNIVKDALGLYHFFKSPTYKYIPCTHNIINKL